MSKLGIGRALALAGVIALAGGAISLAAKSGEGSETTDVAQVHQGFGPPGMGGGRGFDGPPHGGDMRRRGMRPPSAADRREKRAEFAKALGAELGKSQKEVEDALRNVFKDRLDQAVKDENLTQKQADRILECYDSNSCMHPGPPM